MKRMQISLPNRAVEWREDHLALLDQRVLPQEIVFNEYRDAPSVAVAIREMVVRGAPAIGVTAAYAMVLSAMRHDWDSTHNVQAIEKDISTLGEARPTAVNLRWALDRMRTCFQKPTKITVASLLEEAQSIHQEDIQGNRRMGELGAAFIDESSQVITHCNAGALATGGYGTALGVVRSAFEQNKIDLVYVDETRPWFQGSRLTAWELIEDQVPVKLVCDSAAACAMRGDRIRWMIVGADRVAANGDVANKIGTYSLAVNARHHGVKVMVVAPTSTLDMQTPNGEAIRIEERAHSEVLSWNEMQIGDHQTPVWNPVFDITPASMVDVLVTEKGAVEQPNREKIERLMQKGA